MQLDLNDREGALLRNILERHLGDFRMEISNTENYDMRKSMQGDEESLKRILRELGSKVPMTG